jgi:hypothetical protein
MSDLSLDKEPDKYGLKAATRTEVQAYADGYGQDPDKTASAKVELLRRDRADADKTEADRRRFETELVRTRIEAGAKLTVAQLHTARYSLWAAIFAAIATGILALIAVLQFFRDP